MSYFISVLWIRLVRIYLTVLDIQIDPRPSLCSAFSPVNDHASESGARWTTVLTVGIRDLFTSLGMRACFCRLSSDGRLGSMLSDWSKAWAWPCCVERVRLWSFDAFAMSYASVLIAVCSRFSSLALRTRACRRLTFGLWVSSEELAAETCSQRSMLSGFDSLLLNSACFGLCSQSTCAFIESVPSAGFFCHRNAAGSRETNRRLSCSCSC